jgi:hypothetical protein
MNSKDKHINTIKKFVESDKFYSVSFSSIVQNYSFDELIVVISRICRKYLSSDIEEIFFQYLSVGYSLGILLENGNKIHFKVLNKKWEDIETLKFKIDYQNYLQNSGVKTLIYLSPPIFQDNQYFIISEFNQEGEFVDTQRPEYRKLIAYELEKINNCFNHNPFKDIKKYNLIKDDISEKGWADTHNINFDFSRHKKETSWIDDRMHDSLKTIREYSDFEKKVISHNDFTGKHFKFKDGKIAIIYDWDSLNYMSLYRNIASAAMTYPYNDEIGNIKFSGYNDLFVFFNDYQEAGNFRFTKNELTLLSAYCTYLASYTCKCLCTISEDKNGIAYMETFEIAKIIKEAKNGLFFNVNDYYKP